jgi:heme/copper-type cytochrome/quinol oxidase subunit 2
MQGMNCVAIVVAAVAAFVASVVWYALFGNAMTELREADQTAAADSGTSAWTVLFVVAQSLVVAFMLAYFVSRLGIVDWQGAVGVGALVWVFPAAILLGSVVHEGVPLMLAAIHAGDWLVKLLLIAVIVGVWR